MKVVAVTQRVDQFSDRNETRDALDQRLINFVQDAGFIPLPVPNGLYKALPEGNDHTGLKQWVANVNPEAFVLSGGNDIGKCIERDLTESWLLDYASLQQLPVLGICRGMQMLAHWAGGGLHPVHGHVKSRHRISGKINAEVNSYHGFSLTTCPSEFEVLAYSDDKEIEAIRHQSLPWEGWMWHPEREEIFCLRDLQRIKALFVG